MTDIAMMWSNDLQEGDLVLDGPDLATDDGLFTAAIVSLFADARDDAATADPRGFWGDGILMTAGDKTGSWLWKLDRAKLLPETLRLSADYAKAALQWLVDDGVAKAVEVSADRYDTTSAAIAIRIHRPDGSVAGKYDFVWRAYS